MTWVQPIDMTLGLHHNRFVFQSEESSMRRSMAPWERAYLIEKIQGVVLYGAGAVLWVLAVAALVKYLWGF